MCRHMFQQLTSSASSSRGLGAFTPRFRSLTQLTYGTFDSLFSVRCREPEIVDGQQTIKPDFLKTVKR
jgi:hypothetical protein